MTEDQKLNIIYLKQQGFKYQEIADMVGIKKGTVAAYISRHHRDLIKVRKFTEEEVANIIVLRDQGLTYSLIADYYNTNVSRIQTEVNKLLKEGVVQSIRGARGGNLSPSAKTTLYLVKFEDFYKVGITQQKIKDRFKGAPPFILLDSFKATLEEAWELEKLVKSNVKQYVAEHPWFERNGKTECFKTNQPIRYLEDIFAP